MSDLSRSRTIAYVLAAVAVAALGVRQLAGSPGPLASPGPPPRLEIRHGEERPERLTVHVAGAVRAPGVYRLAAGARVDDAVRRAGGAKERADLSQLNLAAELEDGRQVLVPVRPGRGGVPASGAAAAAAASPAPVNLNTATLEQLDTLTGVGPATAQKILDYREAHGGFSNVEELGQVPGIGDVRMAALRELVTV